MADLESLFSLAAGCKVRIVISMRQAAVASPPACAGWTGPRYRMLNRESSSHAMSTRSELPVSPRVRGAGVVWTIMEAGWLARKLGSSTAWTMSKPVWGSSIQAVAQPQGGCLTIWTDSSDPASYALLLWPRPWATGQMSKMCTGSGNKAGEQQAASQRHSGTGGRPDKN